MATLTSFQIDLRRLAVGILYINLGRAAPEFPTTSKAHPSYKVFVNLTPSGAGGRDAYGYLFPFFVRFDIWENVVVPLFEDGSVLIKVVEEKSPSLRHPMNQIRLSQDLEGLLLDIESALLAALEDQGYVPPSSTTEGYVAADGPLVYKTDIQIAADQRAAQAAELAEAVWEEEELDAGPTDPFILRLGLEIPVPSPRPVAPTTTEIVLVVPEPSSPGEPVVRLGTGTRVYQQFDS